MMPRSLSARRLLAALCLVVVVWAAMAPGSAAALWAILPPTAALGAPPASNAPVPRAVSILHAPAPARAAAPRGPPLS